jgi:hypothetical protein
MRALFLRGTAGLHVIVLLALVVIPADLASKRLSGPPGAEARRRFDKRLMDRDAFNPKSKAAIDNQSEPPGENEATDSQPSPTSAAEEDYFRRAYPFDYIPVSARQAARKTWTTFGENKFKGGNNANQPFRWDLIGPTHATMPGLLTFSGAQFREAGRTTAVAISPTCNRSNCRLWVGAAGGGIWRTDNPLSPDPYWVFTSQDFKTNAIGTLDLDPNDLTGNTLYAGTGEPHASSDSESGVGIYKTTDGGDHWTLLPGSVIFDSRAISKVVVVPGQPNHLYVGVARGIRGYSSVTGGAVSRTSGGSDGREQANLGVWESLDGGATFVIAWDVETTSIRGVTDVGLDPQNPDAVYAAAFNIGIFRRWPSRGEATFTQVFATAHPGSNTSRTMFDLTVKAGNTRIYASDGDLGPVFTEDEEGNQVEVPDSASGLWRVDNADKLPAAALLATQANPRDGIGWERKTSATDFPRSAPGRESYNFCTGQCWYDQDVVTPKDRTPSGTVFYPDVVYLIGSYNYNELRGPSNARGVLLSLTAADPDPSCRGCTFSDLTWDDTPPFQPDQTHPDQHGLVTVPGNPLLYFETSDGGLIRNDGTFDDASDDCLARGLDPDSLVLCQKLLSRVPHQLHDTVNKGLSTLQFQSVSVNPKRPLHNVQGGTQDNGTLEWTSATTQWSNIMYGDGGQSGYNYCDPRIRFNEFTNQATDENFRDGDPRFWVVTSGPLFNSGGESAPFYFAAISDYTNCGPIGNFPLFQAATAIAANANSVRDTSGNLIGPGRLGNFLGFQYAGLNHVWRTVDNGGPQDFLEANCPEFTTFANDPRCGDWKPLGGPRGRNQPGDLTGTVYGVTKQGGNVVAIERNPSDSGTAWAATTAGRVFITHNIDAVDPAAVLWQRLDTIAVTTPPNAVPPNRFVTSIHPDPFNLNRAFISYSGYNQLALTLNPPSPGHVFEVNVIGAVSTWRDLNVEQGTAQHVFPPGDIPITDLVRDDYLGDLYAATDFGVVRGTPGPGPLVVYTWTQAGTNLPFVEVAGLTIDPCSRVVYAATHGRSIWRMFLPDAPNAPKQGCPRMP